MKTTVQEAPERIGVVEVFGRYSGETALFSGYLASVDRTIISEVPFNIEKLWQKMWVASYTGGKDVNVGITGIETALWDIVGKALNTPVYNLLGGRCHERIRLYADYADDHAWWHSALWRAMPQPTATGMRLAPVQMQF